MDISRKHDLKDIEKGLKSPDPLMRKVAGNAADKVKKQLNDSWTVSARETLIKETMKGKNGDATYIRDEMVKHRGGRLGKDNRGELLTSAVHWAPGQYERVFGHG